jgi:hypothetical protein
MDPKHVQLHNPYKPKLLFEFIAFVAIDPRVEFVEAATIFGRKVDRGLASN